MNSTLMKIAFAYIAGIGTYALFQNHNISKKLDVMSGTEIHSNSESPGILNTDSSGAPQVKALAMAAPAGTSCACDNEYRYNVTHILESQNIAIPKIPDCVTMVHNANPGPTPVAAGAWFSKITLDNMFCNKPDANGIFVYKALTALNQPTYIIEAARTEYIRSSDDGTSYVYYSRTMCPTECGVCW